MALVKILALNLFAGASFQKLEAGQVYDVDNAIAEKWIAEGKAEKSTEKKGERLVFEVATPSQSGSDSDDLQLKLEEAEAENSALKESLADAIKRAEAAESALDAATKKDK